MENGFCKQHSGLESRMNIIEKDNSKQWEAIEKIMNRPPIYVSVIYAFLTFMLGCAFTYASMAVKIAEMIKKP